MSHLFILDIFIQIPDGMCGISVFFPNNAGETGVIGLCSSRRLVKLHF